MIMMMLMMAMTTTVIMMNLMLIDKNTSMEFDHRSEMSPEKGCWW